MKKLATIGLMEEPWMHHVPVQNTTLEEEIGIFEAEFQQDDDVMYRHSSSLM